VSNFREIRPIGAALTHADRRTDRKKDMTKLKGAFCDYAKEPKNFNYQIEITYTRLHQICQIKHKICPFLPCL